MIQAFKHHWIGIEQLTKALLKGKFLLFFIPGLIVGLIYLYFQYQAQKALAIVHIADGVPLVGTAISWVADSVFSIFDVIFSEFYKFVILVILSPVNCILSEKFDSYLTGKEYKFDFIRLLNDFLRMILIVISALFMEYIFLAIWWVFSWFLPDFIGETIFFLIASFFVGFSFYDYSMERYGLSFFKSWGLGFSKLGYMLITGGIFTLLIKIPVIGIIVAPVLISMLSTAVYILLNSKNQPIPIQKDQDQLDI
jgi:CysZ protein